jgi:N-acetylneuraminic acid mutarotase
MKRFPCALLTLLLVSFQPLFAQTQGQWASTGSMQSAREFNAQVPVSGGKILTMGGADNSGNILASAELYNPSTGKWTLTGSLAEAREYSPAVVLKSGKVLVSGGLGTSSIVLGTAELYDPTTGVWTSAAPLSVARVGHTATLLSNGKVLVAGGCTDNICGTHTAVSELYDPTSNTWSTTGSLNTARTFHTAVALKTGKVLVIGGSTGAGVTTTSCELYDSTKGTWTTAASTTTARYLNATTLLKDGKVLVTGGDASRFPVNSAELYDPTANTWTLTGNMTTGRYAHTANLLTDGTVVVAGGIGTSISCGKDCSSYIPTNKVDIYNETTGTFNATASLSQSLAYHSTTMLTSGRALEAGGYATTSICCTVENTASDYTPLSLTFSATSLNFGLLQIGLSSPSQTVTINNVSTHSVTFTSITSSGDYADANTCPTTPATLNAGQSCTITVTFTPTKSGTRSGAVILKDNCPGSSSQTITLTGTGVTLALGFLPASLNLGSVVAGSSSTMTATLTNDGSSSVNITGSSISPANGTFTQTNNCPATLSVQQTCTFTIVFRPPDVGTYNATVSVTNSAGSAATLALTGMGLNN